jgi:formylglycine-generating enzyme required for sulfatase activity
MNGRAIARLGALTMLVARTAAPDAPRERVRVPAGSFVQGHDDAERADEKPAHTVHVGAFEMDATLVTRAAFERFVGATGYVTSAERLGFGMAAREGMDDWEWARVPHGSWRAPFLDGTPESDAFVRPDAPVVTVSWDDADAYCRHEGARLPTEAEWEYAARSGGKDQRYPWGDEEADCGLAVVSGCGGATAPVCSKPAGNTRQGLCDMAGDAWEWVQDWYHPSYAGAPADGSAWEDSGASRVYRGGAWYSASGYALSAYRGFNDPNYRFDGLGFRAAR